MASFKGLFYFEARKEGGKSSSLEASLGASTFQLIARLDRFEHAIVAAIAKSSGQIYGVSFFISK